MSQPIQRQRLTPQPGQVKRAKLLLAKVPPLSFDWTSPEGKSFLAFAVELVNQGVPVSWLAAHLNLDSARLYAALNRFERGGQAV